MSDTSKEDQNSLNELGSVLLKSLSKDALRTLSLAHDCGYLDTIMDKEVNPKVAEYFPEEFYDDLQFDGLKVPVDEIDVAEITAEEAAKVLKEFNVAEEKDQTSGYFGLIVGCNDSRDGLEDIDDDDVVDKMILDEEDLI